MSIIQISKIQQRSGNIVDLPQLDEAEFGWASDTKQLFIGKTTPNENIEVLTSYSQINFDQINGSVGNLNISNVNIADGQVLAYDGNNWVNRGGTAGGTINLGQVSNVKISGGAIGYVLETDGLGNLSWTPKSTIISFIQNVESTPVVRGLNYATSTDGTTEVISLAANYSYIANTPVIFSGTGFGNITANTTYYIKNVVNSNSITISSTLGGSNLNLSTATGNLTMEVIGTVVTSTQDNFLTDGLRITVTDAQGMTQLNGNTYFVDVLTSNTFALYTDAGLVTPVDSIGFTPYSFTSAASTTASTNVITVGNASVLSVNQEVEFLGGLGNSSLVNNTPYYIKTINTGANTITISETLLANGVAGNTKPLVTETLTSANVYAVGGRAIATVSGGGSSTAAQGSEGSVQYYASGLLQGDADFVWNANATPKTLTATGNVNTGNVNATGVITAPLLTSNIATGTAPLTVTSTTRVANLNVNHANVSDFGVVTNQITGTFFPTFVNSSATGNRALGANANISFNAATGALTSTLFTGTLSTAAQPNVTSLGTLTGLGVNGTITGVNITANTGVFTGNASGLSEINASNLSSGTVPTARLSGSYPISVTSANTAATVTTNAQPNITSVGTLTTLAVTGTTGITSTDSSGAASITKIINAVNATRDLSLIPRAVVTAYNTLVAADDAAIVFSNVSAQGNANLTIAPWAAANTGIRIQSVSNVATIFLNATTTNVSSALQVTNITTGANTTAGTITGNWTLTAGSRMQATYADLAEYYEADDIYEPGTVLMFGGEKEVTLAYDGTSRVAGVVSTNPAYVMNSTCPGLLTAIALQGRVPCKVRGKISKGDMLISGGNGFARPNQFPSMGTVIGKALQDFDGYEGVIEVAVGRL
jgi:hypothetical protein